MTRWLVGLLALLNSVAHAQDQSQAERIKSVFDNLRADNLQILDGFYAPEAEFIDPLGVHNGLPAIKKYYGALYENVKAISFEYHDLVSQQENHVLIWTMKLRVEGLNDGEEVVVDGSSIIKFNDGNKVIYHRDYFDMGELIYEHVPVLGWVIGKVKSRMKR